MPIYKNNSVNTFSVNDVDGNVKDVRPGEIVVTEIEYTIVDLDEISTTHIHNPVLHIHELTMPHVAAIAIDERTKFLLLTHISDSITIALQDATNYVLKDWVNSDPIIPIKQSWKISTKFDQIYVTGTGAGTCVIMEFGYGN